MNKKFDPAVGTNTGLGLDVKVEPDLSTLAGRFIIPPFSVLDARQGEWQKRKRAWLSLGIQSELGRGEMNPESPGDKRYDPAMAYKKKNKR